MALPATTPEPFTGTRRYRIECELGQGGMGVVYKARDLERNAPVALKALSRTDALNIYRLKNEFRQLSDLSHPNLVSLHELVFEGNQWFFTMEYVDGTTFDEYVARTVEELEEPSRKPTTLEPSVTLAQRAMMSERPHGSVACSLTRLRNVLRQLAEATAALHEAGKLHRDLKPSNVLVTPEGRVVVLDFGLVSSSTFVEPQSEDSDRTVGGCVFGTPAYMAPEQAAGDAVTESADWYAIGVMLYEALTGRLPFDGSVLQILRQKDECEPLAPSEIVHGVPDDLDQLCRGLLRRDPDERPTGAQILRYMTGHSAPLPALDGQSSIQLRRQGELFVGRSAQLAQLRAAFEATRAGSQVTVFVHGHSGMGKSALVRCFANELIRHEEAVVLRGRCYERESVPYKAFDNIIDSLSRYMMQLSHEQAAELLPRNIHALARLFPVLRRVRAVANARQPKFSSEDPREIRNQAFQALRDLLLRISDWQPLVINIDDLQWADVDSARLLLHLIGSADAPPILIVGAYRRDEAETSPFLREVLGSGGVAEHIHMVPLDGLLASEAEQLTSALLQEMPTANALFSAVIAAEAAGVPFFINELAQHVRRRSPGAPLELGAVSLDAVVTERIAELPDHARRLLEVLSVAAGPIEQGIAALAADLAPGSESSAMLALRAARLIRTRGTRQTDAAETYHDRVRETVVAHMDPESLRAIHGRIASAIEAWGDADPERLVDHYSGAGDGVRAGETALQAASAATEKLAFNRAAALYRRALEIITPGDPREIRLHCELGDALANAGRGAEAAGEYLTAAKIAAPLERQRLRALAASQLLRSGRADEGLGLARSLLADVDEACPESTLRMAPGILWNRALLSLRGTQRPIRRAENVPPALLARIDAIGAVFRELIAVAPMQSAYLQGRYLRLALRAGEPSRILQGLTWHAFHVAWAAGSSMQPRIEQILDQARELAEEVGTPEAQATHLMIRAGCALWTGEFRSVREPALEAERLFRTECQGRSWECSFVSGIRYGALEFTGDLSELVAQAPLQAREAEERDDRFSSGLLTLALPFVHLMQDRPARAMQVIEQQPQRQGGVFNTFDLWILIRKAGTLLYQGRGADAHAYLHSQWPEFQATYASRMKFLRTTTQYLKIRCALAAFIETGAPELLAEAQSGIQVLESVGLRWSGLLATLMRGAIAQSLGDRQAARDAFARVVKHGETCQADRIASYAAGALARIDSPSTVNESAAYVELRAQGVLVPEHFIAAFIPSHGRT